MQGHSSAGGDTEHLAAGRRLWSSSSPALLPTQAPVLPFFKNSIITLNSCYYQSLQAPASVLAGCARKQTSARCHFPCVSLHLPAPFHSFVPFCQEIPDWWRRRSWELIQPVPNSAAVIQGMIMEGYVPAQNMARAAETGGRMRWFGFFGRKKSWDKPQYSHHHVVLLRKQHKNQGSAAG